RARRLGAARVGVGGWVGLPGGVATSWLLGPPPGPGAGGGASVAGAGTPGFAADLDLERADAVLPVVRLLLGLDDVDENTNNDLAGVTG
ncbi:hypothetical protein ACFV16_20665, partial [Streptomyces massasporeus]|uniref:hypothetical protein n=1 Tax=Streptomyces massasporeus TaxID=67324 RepID=UPI0036B425F4